MSSGTLEKKFKKKIKKMSQMMRYSFHPSKTKEMPAPTGFCHHQGSKARLLSEVCNAG